MRLLPTVVATCLSLICLSGGVWHHALAQDSDAGPLDRPQPVTGEEKPGKPGVVTPSLQPAVVQATSPAAAQAQLRAEVVAEQDVLEKLPRAALEDKAEHGERAAQVALGADFAKEAALLSFAPAAANNAMGVALQWYAIAASRGFPGAPSLDQAGARFYPVRAQREGLR